MGRGLIVFGLLIGIFILGAGNVNATNYYVRNGTGLSTSCGTNWTNACDQLPTILERGSTYYIADGNYTSYVFNDAVNGSQYITIKKAIISDYGTEDGWNDSYGDGQAVFELGSSQRMQFTTSFWDFDGQTKTGDNEGHGFVIRRNLSAYSSYDLVLIGDGWSIPPSNISIKYTEIGNYNFGENDTSIAVNIKQNVANIESNPNNTNYLFQHCYFHDAYNFIASTLGSNFTIEHSLFNNTIDHPSGPNQCEAIHAHSSDNYTIRYNIFKNTYGTGILVLKKTLVNGVYDGTYSDPGNQVIHDGWEVYGNLFYFDENVGGVLGDDGAIGDAGNDGYEEYDEYQSNNMKVYNNVFYNLQGYSGIEFINPNNTGNYVYNNIWYNCSTASVGADEEEFWGGQDTNQLFGSATIHDYNWFDEMLAGGTDHYEDLLANNESNGILGTANPFVSLNFANFSLNQSIAGINLSWMNDLDMYGNTRGEDGVWDVGAIEFQLASLIIPSVNITYPLNTTYSSNITSINYNVDNGSYCWYSNNSGTINSTAVSAGTNFSVNLNESGTVTVYCNNSNGNVGNDSVSFSVSESINPVPQDYIAYYKFEGNASDESGNYDGISYEGVSYVSGHDGQAISIDGVDDNENGVDLLGPDSFNMQGNNLTIAAWINPAQIPTSSRRTIFARAAVDGGDGGESYSLIIPNGGSRIRFSLNNGTDQLECYTDDGRIYENTWHHVVAQWDGAEIRVYVNGDLDLGCNVSDPNFGEIYEVSNRNETGIGGDQSADRYYWNGMIDEVIVYNRSLTEEEVQNVYLGVIPVCGNGQTEGDEECDDGYLVNGDGCNSSCQLESGWSCSGEPSVCEECFDNCPCIIGEEITSSCICGNTAKSDGYCINEDGSLNLGLNTSLSGSVFDYRHALSPYYTYSIAGNIFPTSDSDVETFVTVYSPYDNYNGEGEFSYFVTNGTSNETIVISNITILPVDDSPNLDIEDMVFRVNGSEYEIKTYKLKTNEFDQDVVIYSVDNLPSWASLNTSTGQLNINVSNSEMGSYGPYTFNVTDVTNNSLSGSKSVYITISQSNTYYIDNNSSCSGSACDGLTWETAWKDINYTVKDDNSSGLEGGSTYFIADGNYMPYYFDDYNNGQEVVIKKAINSSLCDILGKTSFECHGSDSGWDDATMGSNQAIFIDPSSTDPLFQFMSDFWTIDGQVGGGPDDWDGSKVPLGIKIEGPQSGDLASYYMIRLGDYDYFDIRDITLKHVEISGEGYGMNLPIDERRAIFGIEATVNEEYNTNYSGPKNILVSDSYFHHLHLNLHVFSVHNMTLERNLFYYDINDYPHNLTRPRQEDGMKSYSPHGLIIRNNIWKDISGSGVIHLNFGNQVGGHTDVTMDDVYIYGNIFYNPSPGRQCSDVGTIAVVDDRFYTTEVLNNVRIYSNTFANLHLIEANATRSQGGVNCGIRAEGESMALFSGYGSINNFSVYNNLFFDIYTPMGEFFNNVTDRSHNWYFNMTDYGQEGIDQSQNFVNTEDSNGQLGWQNIFVDYVGGNFSLTGPTNESVVFDWMDNIDMYGNERGLDGNWDRGAIEYQSILVNPTVFIAYPANTTYSSNITSINYTVDNGSYCWYSNNSGTINSTAVSAGTNFSVNLNESGTVTVYCNNSNGDVGNDSVSFTIDVCTPILTNTSWSTSYVNGSCRPDDTLQYIQNLTQYDSNSCGEVSNVTYYQENRTEACDFCTPSLTNTSWSDWGNISCTAGDLMNQTKNLTQYDSNSCGEVANVTYFEFQLSGSCDYCTPSLINTSWSTSYVNGSCRPDNTLQYIQNLTQYDSNSCGEVSNVTYFQENRTEDCIYNDTTAPSTNTSISIPIIQQGNTSITRWSRNNVLINLTCTDDDSCNNTYYCIDQNNTCNPFQGNTTNGSLVNITQDGVNYLRYASDDVNNNTENVSVLIVRKAENPPEPLWTRFKNNLTTNFSQQGTQNITNLTIAVPNKAKIMFLEIIDLIKHNGTFVQPNLDVDINISDNLISVNSSSLDMLNVSVELTFYIVTFTTPKIQKNGVDLDSSEYNLTQSPNSSNNYTMIINVSGFSTYEVVEGYVAPNNDPPSGGSGGSSSSSAPPPPSFVIPVTDSWQLNNLSKYGINQLNISGDLYRIIVREISEDNLKFYLTGQDEISVPIHSKAMLDVNLDGIVDAELVYEKYVSATMAKIKVRRYTEKEEALIEPNVPSTPKDDIVETLPAPDLETPSPVETESSVQSWLILGVILGGIILLLSGGSFVFYEIEHKKRPSYKTISKRHHMPELQVQKINDWLRKAKESGKLSEAKNILLEKGWKKELIDDLIELIK